MKVGDLVELSAYGKSVEMICHRRGVVGLVFRKSADWVDTTGYAIQWADECNPQDPWHYDRRDLKHAKVKAYVKQI